MIKQRYPRAWQHLQMASRHKQEMARIWSTALEHGLVDNTVVTDRTGTGRIVAHVDWQHGHQDLLTEELSACTAELWHCLDALVTESVESFSIKQRPRHPDRPRFFPVADSADGFTALLEESCLDGVLTRQMQLVRDCQPFRKRRGVHWIDRMRDGVCQLLAWQEALDAGARVSAWVTPVNPQVHVESPGTVDRIEVAEAGELATERLIASYELRNYRPNYSVVGQAGTYVDLCLDNDRAPAHKDDTFDRRLIEVIDAVGLIAASFAALASQVAGPRRIHLDDRSAVVNRWLPADQSPRQWTDTELEELAESDLGLGRVIDADEFTLIVSTPDGVYERRIPRATGLPHHDRRGTAAEQAVHDAAATWGLPDFVIPPRVERKGTGIREISDGLLVVGARGIIMQTKSRDADASEPAREAAWLNKQIGRAVRQVSGTARRLLDRSVDMDNGRGHRISIDGSSVGWAGVVIIDHPHPPDGYLIPPADGIRVPCVVLLRRDWEFLFDQLRSTYAVVNYLHRVGGSTEALGAEPERYYELAAVDAAAAPSPLEPALEGIGESRSAPMLPALPAGSDDDAHGMVRMVLEDIATIDIEPERYGDRLRVLASIDSLPVAHRTELGRLLLDALSAARQTKPDSIFWRFRTYLSGVGQDQLGFGVCSVLTDETRAAFGAWLRLRHHQRISRSGTTELTSVAVLLTPRKDGYRDWDTTMAAIHGDPELGDEELVQYRSLFPTDRPTTPSGESVPR